MMETFEENDALCRGVAGRRFHPATAGGLYDFDDLAQDAWVGLLQGRLAKEGVIDALRGYHGKSREGFKLGAPLFEVADSVVENAHTHDPRNWIDAAIDAKRAGLEFPPAPPNNGPPCEFCGWPIDLSEIAPRNRSQAKYCCPKCRFDAQYSRKRSRGHD